MKSDYYKGWKIIGDTSATRLKARKCSLKDCVEAAIDQLRSDGTTIPNFAVHVEHGGTVANSYNYPSKTHGVVCMAMRGVVAVWQCEFSAKGATESAVLRNCGLDDGAWICDHRAGEKKRAEALEWLRKKMLDKVLDAIATSNAQGFEEL